MAATADGNSNISRYGPLLLLLTFQNLLFLCFSLNDEGLALLKLKQRVVSDPYGALSDWRDDVGVVSPCSWFGVECSDGKVVVLNLKDMCLGGTLAPEIRYLVHIKSINLRNNTFTGTIPEGMKELKELEVLDLGYNNFSGPLAPDFGNNYSLTILLLDHNELLNNLSPEIHQLEMLSEFQVAETQLSGAFKESSCNKRLIIRTDVKTENAVRKRKLESFPLPSWPKPRPSRGTIPLPPVRPDRSFAPVPAPQNSEVSSIVPAPQNSNVTSSPRSPSLSPPIASTPSIPGKQSQSLSSRHRRLVIITGSIGGTLVLIISLLGIYFWKTNKTTVKPWVTGLSGQLQKAFVTGVPNLKRSELEAGCEDFSNVIGSSPLGTLYKGTLSSGVEIAVASVAAKSSKDWSKNLEVQFRKKIETLSKVNHKNFINLLGYCEEEEPFTRMLVFEYAPNGTFFEHLHIKESEHLNWGMRLRIAMGMAYCLERMHQLDPPLAHSNLNSSSVHLTEDYAAKISDFSFSNEMAVPEMDASARKHLDTPLARPESNVYSYGVLLFEMVTGRLPYSVDNDDSLEDWASDYLRGDQPLKEMVDPTLESFEEDKLERIDELIKSCVHPDPRQRPAMRDVTTRLREITAITPDAATPKISPLWWAELEIMSADAS